MARKCPDCGANIMGDGSLHKYVCAPKNKPQVASEPSSSIGDQKLPPRGTASEPWTNLPSQRPAGPHPPKVVREVIVARDGTQYETQADGSIRKLEEKATPDEVQKLAAEEQEKMARPEKREVYISEVVLLLLSEFPKRIERPLLVTELVGPAVNGELFLEPDDAGTEWCRNFMFSRPDAQNRQVRVAAALRGKHVGEWRFK